jgi:hypothetical protein
MARSFFCSFEVLFGGLRKIPYRCTAIFYFKKSNVFFIQILDISLILDLVSNQDPVKMDPKHCLLLFLAHPKLRFRKNKGTEYRTVRNGARTVPFCLLPSSIGYSDYDVFLESDKGSLVYRYKK